MTVSHTQKEGVGSEKGEAASVGLQRRCKNSGGGRDANGHTHVSFMDISIMWSFGEAGYETRLSTPIQRLPKENSVPTKPLLSLWCGSDSFSNE